MSNNESKNNKKILTIIFALIVIVLIIILGLGISKKVKKEKEDTPFKNSSIAMGTVISEVIYASSNDAAKNLAQDITLLINKLDSENLSWRLNGADIYKLNQNSSTKVSPLTIDCINDCLDVSKASNGAFDITVGKLSTLWGIGTPEAHVPTDEEIKKALSLIDYKEVKINDDTVSTERIRPSAFSR